MPDPEPFFDPDRRTSESLGHYQADDDIELPPLDDESSSTDAWESEVADGEHARKPAASPAPWLATAALMAVVIGGGWMLLRSGSAEQEHPNWQHVSAATEASADSNNYLTHLNQGAATLVQSVELTSRDRDRATMQNVRTAIRRGDLAAATTHLQAAQKFSLENPDAQGPDLATNPQLATAFDNRSNELYEIVLSDCCDEDGDVVEVLVNGASFATVPIMHQGTSVTIPLQRGNNTVTIRGVKDGGGGVTLSFRTNRGEYVCRSIRVGEEYRMGVVVK